MGNLQEFKLDAESKQEHVKTPWEDEMEPGDFISFRQSYEFGKYLKDHYELTDYRIVPDVAKDYEKDIEFYNFMRDDQLRELKEYGELMSYGANAIEN